MATYEKCGTCGWTGIHFEGYEPTNDNCRSCGGEGLVKVTATAKRDYKCDLCRDTIPAGTEYVPIEVTPWTCAPDGDKGYARYHTHRECNSIWREVGHLYEYEIPSDSDCWRQVVEQYKAMQASAPPAAPSAIDEWFAEPVEAAASLDTTKEGK